ncbi:hypothetical protein [Deinococcus sp.]|uniref:variant leucine-rich repeat-containing protein n=1 Tax=Deinococcus sp. TaxID=47478 RepID=UPI0025BEFB71|nr:hypothetical protein [Deinococcus sp.]
MANEDWAKDPNTRPEVLAMLSTSPSEVVRLLVAQNPSTPDTALMHLAQDEDDQVRQAILKRSRVSSEILRVAALPRELLSELEAPPQPAVVTEEVTEAATSDRASSTLPAEEGAASTPAAALQSPTPPAAPQKKRSMFDWFWRLFRRSA